MNRIINASLLSMGLSILSTGAWAQFLPSMDASAVRAQIQQQLSDNASESAIVNAAVAAKVNPAHVIDALLALTPKAKASETVALLSKTYKDNTVALNAVFSAAQRNTQLGLSVEQIRQLVAGNSGNTDFGLAGVAGGNTVLSSGLNTVNNLFNVNSPVAATGSGTPASPN